MPPSAVVGATRAAADRHAARLTFAHLSDPHLTTLAACRPTELRDKRVLGYLSWRRRRRHRHLRSRLAALEARIAAAAPDHVVITGDLTHIGHPLEIEDAADWLAGLGRPQDVTLIPGNHDLYVADPHRRMLRRWAPWLEGDDAEPGAADRALEFPTLRVRGPVAFIGLSSAAPSAPLLATGRLGTAQLGRLAALLRATAESGLCRVVLIHHAPVPGLDPWRKRLVDARALAGVLRDQGAELVLHGHGHEARSVRLETVSGDTPVIQAPSASAVSERPHRRAAWNLCTVERRPGGFHIAVEPRGADAGAETTPAQEFLLPAA